MAGENAPSEARNSNSENPNPPNAEPQSAPPIAYGLPNPDTESEISRLDTQHNIWALCLRGLSTTPLPSPSSSSSPPTAPPTTTTPFTVLDIGCGTGAWSLSYAHTHSSATVLGVDLNPPSADEKDKPRNCHFLKANAEEAWEDTFLNDYGPFDRIHARMLVLGIRDWDSFYGRCFKALKPGGWLEAPDCTLGIWASRPVEDEEPTAVETWGLTLEKATEADGRDWRANEQSTSRLRAAGFEEVEERWFEWPAGYLDEESLAHLESEEQERRTGMAGLTLKNCQGFTLPVSKGLFVRSGVLGMDEAEDLGRKALEGLVGEEAQRRRYFLKMSYHKGRKPFGR